MAEFFQFVSNFTIRLESGEKIFKNEIVSSLFFEKNNLDLNLMLKNKIFSKIKTEKQITEDYKDFIMAEADRILFGDD